MPVTENGAGTGTATAGGVMVGSVITGGVIAGGGSLNVIQPGMSASSSDKERKTDLFNLVTSHNMLPLPQHVYLLIIHYVKYSKLFYEYRRGATQGKKKENPL
jgi:hypothetical protein